MWKKSQLERILELERQNKKFIAKQEIAKEKQRQLESNIARLVSISRIISITLIFPVKNEKT